MTAALRKGPATGIAEMIPNTTDFQEANFRGQFSSYPLRKKKEKTPNGHGTGYPTFLFITGGIPIKMTTSNQIPSERMVS